MKKLTLNNYFRSNVQSKLQRFSPTSTACTSTDTFQPPSSQHISTPTPSQSPKPNSSLQSSTPRSSTSFTKVKSRQPIIVEQTTPTQNIIDDEDDSKPRIVPEKCFIDSVAKDSLSATYGRHLVEDVVVSEDGLRNINLTLRDLTKEAATGNGRENGIGSGGNYL